MKHFVLPPDVRALASPVPTRLSSPYVRWGKRALDVVMCIALLPLCGLILLPLWALVRRDGGPGFYKQRRVGRDGRAFWCYKLRSMVPDAEAHLQTLCARDPAMAAQWEAKQKLDPDPRITRIGAFLRATSLDELPQIWNVLRGEMSLVGPRPYLPTQALLYAASGGRTFPPIPPGLTGLWQVESRERTDFGTRAAYDEAYHAQISLATDLRILAKTFTVVLARTGK